MAKKKESTGKELAVVGVEDFAVMQNPEDIKELLEVNMEGEQLSANDLDRVINPSGGSTMFQVPDMDAEDGIVETKAIEGVIIFHKLGRSYWKSAGVSNDPPNCFSTDMCMGIGDPGGDCTSCAFAKFGSAVKQDGTQGDGQACNTRRTMFVLTKDSGLFPIVINATPVSIKATKKYLMNLTTKKRKKVHEVVTRFTLQKGEKNGNKFAELVLTKAADLPPEQIAVIEKYIQDMRPLLDNAASAEMAGGEATAPAEESTPVDVPFPTETDAPPEGMEDQAAA